MDRTLEVPQGRFHLHRHPERARSTLRAWDAGDAYALRHLADADALVGPVAIINDGFGALAAGLRPFDPIVVADTATSRLGIEQNLSRNALAPVSVLTDVLDLPDGLGTVVIKVQKSLGALEDQLHALRPKLTANTIVLGAGMVRQIHTSTLELFENIIGPTVTSLAERKARLIHTQFDPDRVVPENQWPMTWRHNGITVINRGGIFSAASVDIGTRFLLEHLPDGMSSTGDTSSTGGNVVDLGCGNGIVGATIAERHGDASLTFLDTSARAVDSAKKTWAANHGDRPARFEHGDRLVQMVAQGSIDLVLNNPPFHDERAVGDATAWDMFVDSHSVLRPGGELRVVANRHLGHHARLRKIFGNCETVAANRKFVVLSARRGER